MTINNVLNVSNEKPIFKDNIVSISANNALPFLIDDTTAIYNNTYHPYSMNTTNQFSIALKIYTTLYQKDCNNVLQKNLILSEKINTDSQEVTLTLNDQYELIYKPNSNETPKKGDKVDVTYVKKSMDMFLNEPDVYAPYTSYFAGLVDNYLTPYNDGKYFKVENDTLKYKYKNNINDTRFFVAYLPICNVNPNDHTSWKNKSTSDYYLAEFNTTKLLFKRNPYSFMVNNFDFEFKNVRINGISTSKQDQVNESIRLFMNNEVVATSSCAAHQETSHYGSQNLKLISVQEPNSLFAFGLVVDDSVGLMSNGTTLRKDFLKDATRIINFIVATELYTNETLQEQYRGEYGRKILIDYFPPSNTDAGSVNRLTTSNMKNTAQIYTEEQIGTIIENLKSNHSSDPNFTFRFLVYESHSDVVQFINQVNNILSSRHGLTNFITPVVIPSGTSRTQFLTDNPTVEFDLFYGGWVLDYDTLSGVQEAYKYFMSIYPDLSLINDIKQEFDSFDEKVNKDSVTDADIMNFTQVLLSSGTVLPIVSYAGSTLQQPFVNGGEGCACGTCPLSQIITRNIDFTLTQGNQIC